MAPDSSQGKPKTRSRLSPAARMLGSGVRGNMPLATTEEP